MNHFFYSDWEFSILLIVNFISAALIFFIYCFLLFFWTKAHVNEIKRFLSEKTKLLLFASAQNYLKMQLTIILVIVGFNSLLYGGISLSLWFIMYPLLAPFHSLWIAVANILPIVLVGIFYWLFKFIFICKVQINIKKINPNFDFLKGYYLHGRKNKSEAAFWGVNHYFEQWILKQPEKNHCIFSNQCIYRVFYYLSKIINQNQLAANYDQNSKASPKQLVTKVNEYFDGCDLDIKILKMVNFWHDINVN